MPHVLRPSPLAPPFADAAEFMTLCTRVCFETYHNH